jgi:hypothetical protein
MTNLQVMQMGPHVAIVSGKNWSSSSLLVGEPLTFEIQ